MKVKFILLTFFVAFIAVGYANAQTIKPEVTDRIHSSLSRIAKQPFLPDFDIDSLRVTYADSAGIVVTQNVINPIDTTDGVVRTKSFMAVYSPTAEALNRIYVGYEVRVPPISSITLDKASGIASSFAKSNFAEFWQLPGKEVFEQQIPSEGEGTFIFTWKKDYEGLTIGSITVKVRAWDGEIVEALHSETADVKELLGKVKVRPSDAAQKFLKHAKNCCGEETTQVNITNLSLIYFDKPPRLTYIARLSAVSVSGKFRLKATDLLDAMTGEFLSKDLGFARSDQQNKQDNKLIVEDRLPVWTQSGLLFTGKRKLANMPEWAVFGSQLFLQDKQGKQAYLTSDLGVESTPVSGLPNSSWVSIERGGWNYALNLSSGDNYVLGNTERMAKTPFIDSAGKWAVVSGISHAGNQDYDLMANKLSGASALTLRGRIVSSGDDYFPVFSPDGNWLYFVTAKKSKGKNVYSLRRIASKMAQINSLTRIDEKEIETIIPELPHQVFRLSIFPDGKNLLIQTFEDIYLVSIASKKIRLLKFKNMNDAELSLTIERITDGWAGPAFAPSSIPL